MVFPELNYLLHVLHLGMIVVSLGLSVEVGQLGHLPHVLLWLVDILVLDCVVGRVLDLWLLEERVEAVEDIRDCEEGRPVLAEDGHVDPAGGGVDVEVVDLVLEGEGRRVFGELFAEGDFEGEEDVGVGRVAELNDWGSTCGA